MGLFNHLFGSKSDIAREIKFDSDKRLKLWQEHLANFSEREELSKFFSLKNIDNALNNPKELNSVLSRIDSSISRDLVDIGDEIKTEKEIIEDMDRLIHGQRNYEVGSFPSIVSRQKAVFKLLKRLYQILTIEIHAIKSLRNNLNKDLLLKLFKLIYHEEAHINLIFTPGTPSYSSTLEDLNRIIRVILLEEKLTEEMQSAEESFVRNAVKEMGSEQRRGFRRLAEDVYSDVLEMIGAPFGSDIDIDKILKDIEKLCNDRNVILKLIIKNKGRLKLTDEQIGWSVTSFIKTFNNAGFDELNAELYT